MKLYLVEQEINKGYDTFDSFVCVADSEQEAREISPHRFDNTWISFDQIDQLKVTEIGIAHDSQKRGIILASFNAG